MHGSWLKRLLEAVRLPVAAALAMALVLPQAGPAQAAPVVSSTSVSSGIAARTPQVGVHQAKATKRVRVEYHIDWWRDPADGRAYQEVEVGYDTGGLGPCNAKSRCPYLDRSHGKVYLHRRHARVDRAGGRKTYIPAGDTDANRPTTWEYSGHPVRVHRIIFGHRYVVEELVLWLHRWVTVPDA